MYMVFLTDSDNTVSQSIRYTYSTYIVYMYMYM